MFNFFFKRKQITLDCFTVKPHVYEYAKIAPAVKHFPDWWKDTPNTITHSCPVSSGKEDLTIKHCVGLMNFYKKGIIIPSWFSLKLTVNDKKTKTFEWIGSDPSLETHNHCRDQFSKFSDSNTFNFKISSPWIFSSNKKVYFTWTQPTWSMPNTMFEFCVLPGVIDFHTQSATNINALVKYGDKKKVISIEPAQPLVMLHPLTECEVKIQNHLISDLEMEKKLNYNNMIFHWSKFSENSPLKSYHKWYKYREKFMNKLGDNDG